MRAGSGPVRLRFNVRYETEPGYDAATVEAVERSLQSLIIRRYEVPRSLRARTEQMTRPAEMLVSKDVSRSARPPPTRQLRPPRRR